MFYERRVCKGFKIKTLGEFHDLYVQNNTFISPDAFDNFGNISLEIYEIDPARFLLHQD